MKTTLITTIIVCCVSSLKAQQAPILPKQQPLQQFKAFPDSLKGNDLAFKLMDSARRFNTNPVIRQSIIANANIDNMPVAKPQTRSNMPVVQTDRTGYTMPVVGMNNARVYNMPKPAAATPVVPVGNNVK